MDAIIEKTGKWVDENFGSRNGVASFGWVGKKGELNHHNGGACHASMTYLGGYGEGHVSAESLHSVYNILLPMRLKYHQEKDFENILLTYVDWMFNHSPWSEAYMDKDVEWAVKHRVTFSNPDAPSSIVGMSAQCTRVFTEHPAILDTWYELVKGGVHPTVAFVAAHRIYVDDKGLFHKWRPQHTGCFNSFLSTGYSEAGKSGEGYALNFIQNKRVGDTTKDTYRTNPRYATSTFRVWGGGNPQASGLSLVTSLEDVLKKAAKGDAVKNANPFAKAKATSEGVTATSIDKAIPALVSHLEKYKEFI